MHWVERGAEPQGLKRIRERYTQRWVDYCRHGNDSKPSDSRWRDFHRDLCNAFSSLCGYCEETCKGEVDHFRPKSKFPKQVYEWSNWIFACHDCNNMKGEKWPSWGYVNPCAKSRAARPENYFDFDIISGEIVRKKGLSERRHQKAIRMIKDLDLNAFHHLKERLKRIALISEIINMPPGATEDNREKLRSILHRLASRQEQLSSISRAILSEKLSDVISD